MLRLLAFVEIKLKKKAPDKVGEGQGFQGDNNHMRAMRRYKKNEKGDRQKLLETMRVGERGPYPFVCEERETIQWSRIECDKCYRSYARDRVIDQP